MSQIARVPITFAPRADQFPVWPRGWYFAAKSREIKGAPHGVDLFGKRIVIYRASTGKTVAMDGRCWHLGADLAAGSVLEDRIVCSFHGWQFGTSGQCESIPAQTSIPNCAKLQTYATAEVNGRVFVFSSSEKQYEYPRFDGTGYGELIAAPSFEFLIDCPWWMIGTNGFDVQHFAVAHDRRITGSPRITFPHSGAIKAVTTFEVTGSSLRDRLTRRFAGKYVTMDVTVWSGTIAMVIARFHDSPDPEANSKGTMSYGLTEIVPISSHPESRSLVRVTVFRRRRPYRAPFDWLDARIKKHFIREFLKTDTRTLNGARYHPERLIQADAQMANYLRWLADASQGEANWED